MWHKSKYTKENIFFEKIKHYYIRVHPYTLSFLKDVNYNLVGDIHQVTHQDSAPSAVFEQILTFCTKHKSKKELIAFCSFKDLRNFTLKYKCNYYLSQKNLVSNHSAEQTKHQTRYVDQPRAEPDKKRQHQNNRCGYDHQQAFQNLHSSSSFQRSRYRLHRASASLSSSSVTSRLPLVSSISR